MSSTIMSRFVANPKLPGTTLPTEEVPVEEPVKSADVVETLGKLTLHLANIL